MFTLRFHSMPTTLPISLSLSLFLSLVGNVPIRLTANNTGLGMKRRGWSFHQWNWTCKGLGTKLKNTIAPWDACTWWWDTSAMPIDACKKKLTNPTVAESQVLCLYNGDFRTCIWVYLALLEYMHERKFIHLCNNLSWPCGWDGCKHKGKHKWIRSFQPIWSKRIPNINSTHANSLSASTFLQCQWNWIWSN